MTTWFETTFSEPISLISRSVRWCGLGFLAYASASLLWSDYPSLSGLLYLWILAGAFCIGLLVNSLYWLYLSLAAYLSISVAIAILQWIGWEILGYVVYPAGLFGNPNFLGCALALTLVAALSERIYWFLPVGAIGLWLTHFRAAIVSVGVASLFYLWSRAKVTTVAIAVLVPISVYELTKPSLNSLAQRMGIWQDTISNLTIFGNGWGSFEQAYQNFAIRTNMTEIRAEHAYNDFLEMIFMLGVGAIPLWFILGSALEGSAKTERLVLICFLVLGLTYFPLFTPLTGLVAALVIGRLVRI